MKQLAACLSFLVLSAANELPRASRLLEPGKTIERQLAGGESHSYVLTLQAGRFARVAVDQRAIGIVIAIRRPDGQQLSTVRSTTTGGRVVAELIADISGEYDVRVSASVPTAPSGAYAIQLDNISVATESHRSRIAASQAAEEAVILLLQRTREAILSAIERLEEALKHWRAARDPVSEATTLSRMAFAYAEIGEQAKALTSATEALAIGRSFQHPVTEATALNALGSVHNRFGDRRKALEYFQQALPIFRGAGDRPNEGETLNNLGIAYAYTGESRKALAYFDQAVEVYRELQDRRRLATLESNIGVTNGQLGEYRRSLENHRRSLELHREMGNRAGEAVTLNNIGTAHSSLAEYQKALDAYRAALEIHRSLARQLDVGINTHNIAWMYSSLGKPQRALTTYLEALAIFRTVKDRPSLSNTLSNAGAIYAETGDHRKALEFHNEALSLRRAIGDPAGEAGSLNSIGLAYAKLGERTKARDHYEQAINIFRASENRRSLAGALRNLGSLERECSALEKALPYLEESLEISRAVHDGRAEAEALADLARVERDRGDLVRANLRAGEALDRVEALRLTVASPMLRASFLATAHDLQMLQIDVLMRLHAQQPQKSFARAALRASERGRSRSLLETLGESGTEIRWGVDPNLLERERELERVISAKAERQTRLLSGKHTDEEARGTAKELDALVAELDHVQSRIRETSPRYAAQMRLAPLEVEEIQSKVLDRDTVLLEYALGPQRSFLWAVTPDSVDIFELPPKARIDAAVVSLYALLTARNQVRPNETVSQRTIRVPEADKAYAARAAEISRMLLGPVVSLIGDNKRLLIVAEGSLQRLPFAALPEPVGTAARGTKPLPLIVQHEIVMAPSASVVAVLRQEVADRKKAAKTLAVLADPVFSSDDPRTGGLKNTLGEAGRPPVQAASRDFVRLRFSRSEADAISRLAPDGMALKAVDFDASRDNVLGAKMADYRIVHFATHALVNDEQPELSSIVLSLVDRAGRPQNGFLRLYDIYNLRLRSDLVVLSACKTALGKEVNGEGLIGLTRAFLYAGAGRVVASIWEVDDKATAELMKRFYEAMLKHNEEPAAALRTAQVSMWRTRGQDAPYYWAAFTFQGEWR
jgi:CHAT domain-containing protein/Tfp pilus assembly protein PilF